MATHLKKATKDGQSVPVETTQAVVEMLADIRSRGEAAVTELAGRFDNWNRNFILSSEEINELCGQVEQKNKDDLQFAHDQVRIFAEKQLASMQEFETEIYPGVRLGQRLVPCNCAGCYIPGGRFAHAASAIMSVATAKAAGVPHVIACTPPRGDSINPAVAYALKISGADVIMAMGGVQAVASMVFGLFTGKKADILVGPGNAYVAEAKRLLFGEVGIDVFAGPTESLVIADQTADPLFVAVDLVSQAEHGYDSPVWLVTDSKKLAQKVMELVPQVIDDLPNPEVARSSWRDYAEVVLCDDRHEMVSVSDKYAAEHVQVMAQDLSWWLANLKNYGSLFLGEECTVSYGDKTSGTNHILPTIKAARYSGGLNVQKFVKVLTWQQLNKEGARKIAAVTSRISRVEGMEGHARAADLRLKSYYPNEDFNFEVYEQKRRRTR